MEADNGNPCFRPSYYVFSPEINCETREQSKDEAKGRCEGTQVRGKTTRFCHLSLFVLLPRPSLLTFRKCEVWLFGFLVLSHEPELESTKQGESVSHLFTVSTPFLTFDSSFRSFAAHF